MSAHGLETKNKLAEIRESCIECRRCVRDCDMLTSYITNPKHFFQDYLHTGDIDPIIPFSCTLCKRCTMVCPRDLEIPEAFMSIRKDLVNQNNGKPPLKQLQKVTVHQYLSCHPLFTAIKKGVKR